MVSSYLLWGVGAPACALGSALGSALLLYAGYVAYIHRKYSHIPSPRRSNFITGNVSDMNRVKKEHGIEDPFFEAVRFWLQEVESNTFVVFFFHFPMVITVDPNFIKTVILNQANEKTAIYKNNFASIFGKRFMKEALFVKKSYALSKQSRMLYEPGFTPEYLQSIMSTLTESLEPTLKKLREQADGRTQVPMREYIKKLTLEATSLVVFGSSFSTIYSAKSLGVDIPSGDKSDVMTYIVKVCMSGLQKNLDAFFPSLNRFLHPCQAGKYRSSVAALRTVGRNCLAQRRQMFKDKDMLPQDSLSEMLKKNADFDEEQFEDAFCNIFALGYDPLSNAIQIAFILLHQHPNVLERVTEEVESVFGDKSSISADDLNQLVYTEKVFFEALRFYYVAPGTTRLLHKDTVAGEHRIPAGTYVMIGDSNLFRKAEYFKDPDVFNPDRFDSEPIPSIKFWPFGQGPRNCLGRHFCQMTAKLILATLVRNFTIDFPQDYEMAIDRHPAVMPRYDFNCTLKLKREIE